MNSVFCLFVPNIQILRNITHLVTTEGGSKTTAASVRLRTYERNHFRHTSSFHTPKNTSTHIFFRGGNKGFLELLKRAKERPELLGVITFTWRGRRIGCPCPTPQPLPSGDPDTAKGTAGVPAKATTSPAAKTAEQTPSPQDNFSN